MIQRPAAARWAAERKASADKFSFLEERISGVEDLRAVGAEPFALNRLLVLMRRYLEKLRAAFVVSNLTFNLTNLVYGIGYAIGLALGVYLYTRGQASLGTAYLIVYYVGMLSEPLQGIRAQIQDLQQASASLQRVRELFAIQSRLENGMPAGAAAHLPAGPLEVAFEQVSFAYQDGLSGRANGTHTKLERARQTTWAEVSAGERCQLDERGRYEREPGAGGNLLPPAGRQGVGRAGAHGQRQIHPDAPAVPPVRSHPGSHPAGRGRPAVRPRQ